MTVVDRSWSKALLNQSEEMVEGRIWVLNVFLHLGMEEEHHR